MVSDFPTVIENEEAKGEDSSDDTSTPSVNKEIATCLKRKESQVSSLLSYY